ncbi:hypothetical protein ONZ45_g5924 [Pleurotus djamor]|nr:hypothetical protein ONZ45_g5924 [Pleurotus djamor]
MNSSFKLLTMAALSFAALGYASAVHSHPAPLAKVYSKCTVPNTVALTFDDGPSPYLHGISEALLAVGGKGTFFLSGNYTTCIYDDVNIERVKYAYSKGHEIGVHGWTHPDYTTLTRGQLDLELDRIELALRRIVGLKPAFMRPPFGTYNDLVREVVAAHGQKIAEWDFAPDPEAPTAEIIAAYDTLVGQHPDTILAVTHEILQEFSEVVVPHAIQKLSEAGYKLVTFSECIGERPYLWVGILEVLGNKV